MLRKKYKYNYSNIYNIINRMSFPRQAWSKSVYCYCSAKLSQTTFYGVSMDVVCQNFGTEPPVLVKVFVPN